MKQFDVTMENMPQSMDHLRQAMLDMKVNREDALRAALAAEDITEMLLLKSTKKQVSLTLWKFGSRIRLKLVSEGEKASLDDLNLRFLDLENTDDEEVNQVAKQLTKKVLGDSTSIRYRGGKNICFVTVAYVRGAELIHMAEAMGAGILVGFVLKVICSEELLSIISSDILASIETVFLNAIKMIVGPLVFFSMAASIAEFSDFKALGRIGGKTITGYLLTSVLAILVGFGAYQLFPIGDTSLQAAVTDAAASTIASSKGVTISIKDTLIGIVPSSFLTPFEENNMLGIIFLGILLGMAAGMLNNSYPSIKNALNACNALFSKVTSIIVGFLPLVVFCSMTKMIMTTDFAIFLKVVAWIPVVCFGSIIMILIYCLLIFSVGRLNPLHFLRAYFPAMLTAFTLDSSSATMPVSMDCCKKMGVSRKVYSFSIPLGATINMDGVCILLIITSLFMAKIFGIQIGGGDLLTLFLAIMAISVGAPGVPGILLVCLSLLLPQIGVPAEAISLIMGIQVLCEMVITAVNVTGDAALTTIVARTEKLLDEEQYNKN